jgi:hypothetical protein
LKAAEAQFGQQHEDGGRTQEYYHIIFFLKGLEILHQEKRGHVETIVLKHVNSILFPNSEPANKQHTYQSINQSINWECF